MKSYGREVEMAENYDKIGTELNLALQLTEEMRQKSLDLNVGFQKATESWDLIVRYVNDLGAVAEQIPFTYEELLNQYAVIHIAEKQIRSLSLHPDIIWIEKPKSLIYEIESAAQSSCIPAVMKPPYGLTGQGTVAAVVDSGLNIFRSEFRNSDGSTKLEGFWNQSEDYYRSGYEGKGTVDPPYGRGHFYSREELDFILKQFGNQPPYGVSASFDKSGHGTAVCGVLQRTAPETRMLPVKLAEPQQNPFPRTIELMEGIDFAARYSMNQQVPMVINLSFGNNYGDHDSNAFLEHYIDDIATLSKLTMVTGTGNDGASGRHAQGMLGNISFGRHEFAVSDYEAGLNLQVWRRYGDVADIFLITPSRTEIGPFNRTAESMKYKVGQNEVAVINGSPTPYNQYQETYISILPEKDYIEAGLWQVRLNPKRILDGRYDIYLPVAGSTSGDAYFLSPSLYTTLTIPSTARRIISVGAYNHRTGAYASFSGRGFTVNDTVKPELVAPGVQLTVPSPENDGFLTVSGTSFAAPFVSGSAALLMEWGIVQGRDPYLYGEKLKSYLIRGAGKLSGYRDYPNPEVGWGTLCVSRSLPE
jgi:subtilisin family serine protease